MMATKGSENNHQHRSASTENDPKIDSEYNDFHFNITQNSCDFVPVQSQSQSFNNNSSRYTATDFDPDNSYPPRACRDMTINTTIESYLDTTSEEKPQNHRRKTNSTNPNNIDNSTLSLHIAEYENSSSRSVNPKTSGLSFGPPLRNAKTNSDLSFVNDPLEPLRYIGKEPVAAETMPFKTSQKLLNLNSSIMKKIPPKPLPRSKTRQAIVSYSNAISNDLEHLNLTRNLPDLERTYTIPSSDLERTTSSIFGSTSESRGIVTDHEPQQEQQSHASEGAELCRAYPTQFDEKDFQLVPQRHYVFDSTVESDATLQTSWRDERKSLELKFLNETIQNPVEIEREISYLNQPYQQQQPPQNSVQQQSPHPSTIGMQQSPHHQTLNPAETSSNTAKFIAGKRVEQQKGAEKHERIRQHQARQQQQYRQNYTPVYMSPVAPRTATIGNEGDDNGGAPPVRLVPEVFIFDGDESKLMPGMRVKIATGNTYFLPKVNIQGNDAAKIHWLQIKAGRKFRKEVRKIVAWDKTYRQNIAKYAQNK